MNGVGQRRPSWAEPEPYRAGPGEYAPYGQGAYAYAEPYEQHGPYEYTEPYEQHRPYEYTEPYEYAQPYEYAPTPPPP
ncbi:hypothetical protein G5C51_33855, partial [Streptomyces sp. A7024]|nr:hypothetical protein [Streptomyces coryli]